MGLDRGGYGWFPDPFCLLYTSDAADDLLCVDLGGRRIIKKKKKKYFFFFFFFYFFFFFFFVFFFFKQKTAYEIASCLVGSEMCIRDSKMHTPSTSPTSARSAQVRPSHDVMLSRLRALEPSCSRTLMLSCTHALGLSSRDAVLLSCLQALV